MTCWYEGPLAAFDTETTGVDVEDRPDSFGRVVVQDGPGARPRVTRWLVNPGVPGTEGATAVHGLTDRAPPAQRALAGARDGRDRRGAGRAGSMGRPLVIMNAPFDLTILDRELKRHRAARWATTSARDPLRVLDPRVLDKHLDRYRKGRRTLTDLCDALRRDAGGRARRGRGRAGRPGGRTGRGAQFRGPPGAALAAELHTLQTTWHAAQARGLQAWFARQGTAELVDTAWPLRPELPAAA